MDINWILINNDKSHKEVTLTETELPVVGKTKTFAGQTYDIHYVLAKRVSGRSPMVIAIEPN